MTYPRCYPNQHEFDRWKLFASAAREWSTPCSDCSKPHEDNMKAKGRCDKKTVKIEFKHVPSKKHK